MTVCNGSRLREFEPCRGQQLNLLLGGTRFGLALLLSLMLSSASSGPGLSSSTPRMHSMSMCGPLLWEYPADVLRLGEYTSTREALRSIECIEQTDASLQPFTGKAMAAFGRKSTLSRL